LLDLTRAILCRVHRLDTSNEVLTQAVVRYALERMRMDPPPLDHPRTEAELRAMTGRTISEDGIGGLEALRIFSEVLAPACVSIDHPRFLSFVPCAPTEAATLFDLVVGAGGMFGGTWLESAGAVFAENEALRWLADLAGLPPSAGGVFVSGGSAANLSALVVARSRWREQDPGRARVRPIVVTSTGAHSSIAAACRVMDADVVAVEADEHGRASGASMRAGVEWMADADRDRIAAVVATAGTTNVGVVDDLAGIADVAADLGAWYHVDAAYGGAALAAPSARPLFDGIERSDSFVVDPHKWLFAPFDCAALLYREPALARATHTQHAEYLDIVTDTPHWNPSDYAYHLSRRARGLPFWFSLATHGTRAYREAIESTLDLTTAAADLITATGHTELVLEPGLSIVVFRRVGWSRDDYYAWSDQALDDGLAFVVPTSWRGETVLRFCFVNPLTTPDDVQAILDSLA
jgi:glutamate/tyrosine decarboxylase-like PLP-dependent enzyme